MTRKRIVTNVVAATLVAGCCAACAADTPSFPGVSALDAMKRVVAATTPQQLSAYLTQAFQAASNPDPLEGCKQFPDVPGNAWPKGLALENCALSFGSGITRQQVDSLVSQKKFAELDALYAADQARHFSKKGFSEAIHGDFYFFDGGMASDELSARWVSQAPQSPYAAIARGNHLMQAVRRIRAARPERLMSDEQRKVMYAVGEQSASEFRRAAALAPNMIEAYNGLAHVGTVGSAEGAEAEGIEKGKKVDPLCAPLAMQEMWSLMPRWGGSREAMGARADELTKHLAERPLLSLAASMPAVEDADQVMFRGGDVWRAEVAQLMLPYAAVTTSQEVASRLGTGACCNAGANNKVLYKVQHVAASRFGRGQSQDALNRAVALLNEVPQFPTWPLLDTDYVLEREPDNVRAHIIKGMALRASKRFAESEPELRRSMADPEYRASSLYELSQTLASLNRFPEAHEIAEQFHNEYPENQEHYVWLQDYLKRAEAEAALRPAAGASGANSH